MSRTFEAGLRASIPVFEKGRLRYSLALYRSDLDDDIAFINSPVQGRAFFGAARQPAARHPGPSAGSGATYKVTDKWTLGANLVAARRVYLVGDEANLTAPLPPYATLDLTTRYRPLPNVEVFAWARNVTNSWYYSFGTFSPTSSRSRKRRGQPSHPATALRRRPPYSVVCESPSR